MFGSTATSAFGQPQQQSSTFGGFSGFGSTTNTAAPTASSTTSNMFGQTNAPTTTGFGGFGGTNTSTLAAPSSGFGSFGQSASGGNTNMFSAPTTQITSGFGGLGTSSTAPTNNTAGSFGSLGFSASTTNSFGSGGTTSTPLFAGLASAAPGAFGTTSVSTPASKPFGGFTSTAIPFGSGATTQNAPSSVGGFASFGQTAGFGTNTFGQPGTSFQLGGNTQTSSLGVCEAPVKNILKQYAPNIDNNWNPLSQPLDSNSRANPDCKFAAVTYRKYDGAAIPPELEVVRTQEIDKFNPDPENFFPIKELGVANLQLRFNNQSTSIDKNQKSIQELQGIIKKAEISYDQLLGRYESLKLQHTQLQSTLLNILRKIEVTRCRGVPLRSSEIK